MTAPIATATPPSDEDKARARHFRDFIVDMLDPLLIEGRLHDGMAARESVEALIALHRDGTLAGHRWDEHHPFLVVHPGLKIWQTNNLACARAFGEEFADVDKWSPDAHHYLFVGRDRLALVGLEARCKDLRQRLAL
ncbi:hypothetical protein GCM10007862_15620 [Dyella lipolytica]|uniref:Uncharacterized protein n=1 Tax=Dyella lipolytica TaxID=1867835 RepID=A0ABW8ITE7_9GAMM|nr:hypothetical protein [Dyella lipolytica]GLQ46511.1 hypothetical protein GCM10007862_15620 [Dyella lipolytica]